MQPEAIVRVLLAAMDNGDLSIVDALCSSSLRVHFMDQELDLSQVKQASGGFIAAFPDIRHSIEELSSDGDRVTLRARDRATHLGTYRGIAATGRVVEFETTATYRIENGKIEEIWQQMDVQSLLRQIG